MSMINERIKALRDAAQVYAENGIGLILKDAADTIEELSAKLAAANMERSTAYYNNAWIPVVDRLPEEPEAGIQDPTAFPEYIVMIYGAYIPTVLSYAGGGRWYDNVTKLLYKVIAWRPLPEPYQPEDKL